MNRDDLVFRLRWPNIPGPQDNPIRVALCVEAADEIDRLRRANEAQRESLKVAYDTIADKNWRLATIRGALEANAANGQSQK
jgi:hypothetical protein